MGYELRAIDRDSLGVDLAAMASKAPLSVALVDVDQLRRINAEHGHEVGDRVLAMVVGKLAMSLGDGDGVLLRTAGDEFAVLLPGAGPEEALILLEGARSELSGVRHHLGDREVDVAISVGVASYPQHVDAPGKLLDAAEAALHRAKTEGRGRVTIFVEDRMVLKSNYYAKAQLARLAALADRLERTEASLLREALASVIDRYKEHL